MAITSIYISEILNSAHIDEVLRTAPYERKER